MSDRVRIWRPPGGARLIAMHGTTTRYAIEPDGTYVLGLVVRGAFRAARGRARHDVRAGDVVAWEPWTPHWGRGVDGAPWEARLIMIEPPDMLAALTDDVASMDMDVRPPRPVVRDAGLAARFAALHRGLERPGWALQRELELAAWLRDLAGAPEPERPGRRRARADPALRRACEFLAETLDRNVSLDELAAAAGVSRFRVARLFRAGLGLPPHRFQLAHRLRLARRLLERGAAPGEAAARTGFFDQSHLHRHFVRTMGITPGRYAAAFR